MRRCLSQPQAGSSFKHVLKGKSAGSPTSESWAFHCSWNPLPWGDITRQQNCSRSFILSLIAYHGHGSTFEPAKGYKQVFVWATKFEAKAPNLSLCVASFPWYPGAKQFGTRRATPKAHRRRGALGSSWRTTSSAPWRRQRRATARGMWVWVKIKPPGFSPGLHLPGPHVGYYFLTHCHLFLRLPEGRPFVGRLPIPFQVIKSWELPKEREVFWVPSENW